MHPIKVSPKAALIHRQKHKNIKKSENFDWISPPKIPNPLTCLGILTYTVHPNKHSWNQSSPVHTKLERRSLQQKLQGDFWKSKVGKSWLLLFCSGKTNGGTKVEVNDSYISRWWSFTNPFEQICANQNGFIFPSSRVKIKNVWNHRPDFVGLKCKVSLRFFRKIGLAWKSEVFLDIPVGVKMWTWLERVRKVGLLPSCGIISFRKKISQVQKLRLYGT